MWLLCSLSIATCIKIAGITLPITDAESIYYLCDGVESIPVKEFGLVRSDDRIKFGSGGVPGKGLIRISLISDHGLDIYNSYDNYKPAEKRLKLISVCKQVERDFLHR